MYTVFCNKKVIGFEEFRYNVGSLLVIEGKIYKVVKYVGFNMHVSER